MLLSKKFVFQHSPKRWCEKLLPCERIFRFWQRPNLSTSPARGNAKKCYHVNVFSTFENRQFFQQRPHKVMPKNATIWPYFPSLKMANFFDIPLEASRSSTTCARSRYSAASTPVHAANKYLPLRLQALKPQGASALPPRSSLISMKFEETSAKKQKYSIFINR